MRDGSKASEEQLSRVELARQCEELQLIVDAIPAFVFYKDTNNRIVRVNRAVAESLGTNTAGCDRTIELRLSAA